jgi:hypothetical protein
MELLKKQLHKLVLFLSQNAMSSNGAIWIADYFLVAYLNTPLLFNNTFQTRLGFASGAMLINNNTVYAAAGSVNDAWNYFVQ